MVDRLKIRLTKLFSFFSDKIALDFLNYRRPQSKNHEKRLPHMVNYILGELPFLATGVEHNGIHYKTLLYPTAASKAKSGTCMANDVFYLAREIQTGLEYAAMKKELLEIDQILGSEGVTLLPIDEVEEQVKPIEDTTVTSITTQTIESFKVLMRSTSIGA